MVEIEKLNGRWVLPTQEIIKDIVRVWNRYARVHDRLMVTPLFKHTAKVLLDAIVPCPGGIVHDGGTGTGYWISDILEKTGAGKIIATDISRKMIRKAKKRVKKMDPEIKEKIKLEKMDLLKEWPDEMFDLQVFQLMLNYLPNHQWKDVAKRAIDTTKKGGHIFYSIMLRGFNVKEIAKEHLLEQMRGTPISSFPAMIFSAIIMKDIDDFIAEDKIIPPEKKEFLEFHRIHNCKVEVIDEVIWGAGIVVKVKKL